MAGLAKGWQTTKTLPGASIIELLSSSPVGCEAIRRMRQLGG
jgi:hypothetical protein